MARGVPDLSTASGRRERRDNAGARRGTIPLGVYFSFEGTGGNPWAEEDAYFDRIVGGFFASCATLEPEAKQYRLLVQSNLLSKALFGGGVRWPTEMQMEAARQRCAQGLAKTLDLGSLGGGGGGRCDAESEEDAAAAAERRMPSS